jgi:sialic acid synthase SpsE
LVIHIIAEIGSNWEGSVENGKRHIEAAKKSGASFVKFQMWRARDLYDTTHPNWNEILKSELTLDAAKELKIYANKIGIKWFCSVFYPEAVDFLESINVPFYKIASRTARLRDKFSWETIERVSQTKKVTFISSGEGADKEKISKLFQKKACKFTYCISKYPTNDNDIEWKEIVNYDFFSDHTLGVTIPLIYAVLRKSKTDSDLFIEKHTKFENSQGPDSPFAVTYKEISELASHFKRIERLDLPSFSF